MAEDSVEQEAKSVTLKRREEEDIKYYQEYLEKLAEKRFDDLKHGKDGSYEIIENKDKARASIFMATLLANTTKTLKLYCRGLSPGILCGETEEDSKGFRGAYWEEFKKFFETTIDTKVFAIQILLQSREYLGNLPFKKIKEASERINNSKIQVRAIRSDDKEKIDNELKKRKRGHDYNFAIFDGRAFRLEYDPDEYMAIGSFSSPSWCAELNMLFDDAFKNADRII